MTQAATTSSRAAAAADPSAIVAAIRRVVGPSEKPVGLHEPRFTGNEWRYVKECLDTGWVSYNGAFVARFEEMLREATGAGACIAMVSGTVAIEMALRACGVAAGDEVLAPSLTFVATNNAIVHAGAVPHFVDSEPRTLGIDVPKLAGYLDDVGELTADGLRNRRTGRRIAALMPMHCFGHVVDMDELMELAARWRLTVVEDATEAIGSRYHGRVAGSLAPIACLSFNGNKIVTTGGGGAVLARDPELARRLRHLTTTAKQPHPFEFIHDEVAWNCRMPNVNAALGCAGLEALPQMLAAKRRLQQRYEAAFADVEGVAMYREAAGRQGNHWLATLLLDRPDLALRDRILKACHESGLLCRAAWRLNHTLPMYRGNPRMPLDGAEALQPRIINLPSSPSLAIS
jgi:perosamine synthetase